MKKNHTEEDVYILAIESSCDETAAAVVKNGREVLSNIISSQIALHTIYGGVVPEIASRKHIEKINQVVEAALSEAGMTLEEMDAVGVTYGPGLVGALLVGVAEAKAIAYAAKKPLVGVHHIEGHVSANYIEHPELEPPFMCLIVSGGHTHLVVVKDYGEFEILGRTRDDAAGEAFDKVARLWDWDTRAVRRSIRQRKRAIRRPSVSRGQRWRPTSTISASAASNQPC